jgi:hypothetical protein
MQMRKTYFTVLMFAVVVTVLLAAFGVVWNLVISPTQKFEHVDKLIGGVLLALVGLAIDIGRRWFIDSKFSEDAPKTLIDLVGTAVVIASSTVEEVDQRLTEILDYLEYADTLPEAADEWPYEMMKPAIEQSIARKKVIKFGGPERVAPVKEVLEQGADTAGEDTQDENGDLTILSATYGAGDARKDVTKLLRSRVSRGSLGIRVSNDVLGCDPAPGVVKALEVTYSHGGKTYSRTISESLMLYLP